MVCAHEGGQNVLWGCGPLRRRVWTGGWAADMARGVWRGSLPWVMEQDGGNVRGPSRVWT